MIKFITNGSLVDIKQGTDSGGYSVVASLNSNSKNITWGYGSDVTRINFTIDDRSFDSIPATDIYFDGVALADATEFKAAVEAMFPNLAGGGGGIESVVAGDGIYVDDADPANPAVSTNVLRAEIELTDAQIKALPTTAIQVIVAPGENKIALPLSFALSIDTTSDVYTNINTNGYWFLETDSGYYGTLIGNRAAESLTKLANLLEYNFTAFCFGNINQGVNSANYQTFIPEVLTTTNLANKAVRLKANNGGSGNYTGGNAANSGKIVVYYVVVDL